ncbi:MAG TPA: glycosyltransferase family 2 protein [Candidatus Omnitrophica bacterium]|nr:glycosyltransferase family 2 protein [Candidatus Omnitrophota bacterium]
MKIWIIIPAYNEAQLLECLLRKLKEKNLPIIVIDDGSKDNTFEIAKGSANVVIRNERNLGKGTSLKEAISYLLEKEEFDYVITMDADGQHAPCDIDRFLKEAENGEHFVVGNRMDNPENMPKIRVVTNKLMSFLISQIIGQKIPDTQCGYRLIKREVLEAIVIKTTKFEIESEILIRAAKKGFPIKSIPIESIYSRKRKSKISPFMDTIRFIRFITSFKK